jgi:hypothetical protein
MSASGPKLQSRDQPMTFSRAAAATSLPGGWRPKSNPGTGFDVHYARRDRACSSEGTVMKAKLALFVWQFKNCSSAGACVTLPGFNVCVGDVAFY